MIAKLYLLLPDGVRRLLAEWRRGLSRNVTFILVVGVLAAGVALLLPPWYRATATLLPPPEETSGFGIMAGMIQSAALSKLGMLSTSRAAPCTRS
jgi:uncharacterized protein involved in exopolysaccharide biosynthesis